MATAGQAADGVRVAEDSNVCQTKKATPKPATRPSHPQTEVPMTNKVFSSVSRTESMFCAA